MIFQESPTKQYGIKLMTRICKNMVENLPTDVLPTGWADLDMRVLLKKRYTSINESLCTMPLRALWKYYRSPSIPADLKSSYMDWYSEYGLEEDLSILLIIILLPNGLYLHC